VAEEHFKEIGLSVPFEKIVPVKNEEGNWSGVMYLKQGCAEGTWNGRKFTVASTLPSGNILIAVDKPEGAAKNELGGLMDEYIIRMGPAVRALFEHLEETGG
jgi:hypothetical protein